MRFTLLLLLLSLAGCGYSSDHAIGSHTQDSITYHDIQSVIVGNIVTGTLPKPVFVTAGVQGNEVFLDNEFYFAGISALETFGLTLTATLDNGKILYSFYRGQPMSSADITITDSIDWHGETGSRLTVSGNKDGATVSINPFSNIAYWISYTGFTSYSAARTSVNQKLNLSLCRFERQLCTDHLDYLNSGRNIYATRTGFVISTPGQPDCAGPIASFPACQ